MTNVDFWENGDVGLGKFHHDRTLFSHGFHKGNHPQMAELFRLVKYYNLPRLMCSTRMEKQLFCIFTLYNMHMYLHYSVPN